MTGHRLWMIGKRWTASRWLAVLSAALVLDGCAAGGAPSIVLFGAFFPAWLLCALIGIIAAIVARVVFVATGLSDTLPLQFLVCVSIGLIVAILVWLTVFA